MKFKLIILASIILCSSAKAANWLTAYADVVTPAAGDALVLQDVSDTTSDPIPGISRAYGTTKHILWSTFTSTFYSSGSTPSFLNGDFTGTEALKIPVGTIAQRPGAPVDGDLRIVTDGTPTTEIYRGGSWRDLEAVGSGANTALSNLAAVSINSSLIMGMDNSGDLGTAAIRWRDLYAITAGPGDSLADTFILRARDVDGASWTTFLTLTSNNTPTADLASSVTIGGSQIISAGDIDTYGELNTIVADQTLTNNSLIDTYAELNAIVADQTLTHNALIDTFAEIDAIVADKPLANLTDGGTFAADISVPAEAYAVGWNGNNEAPTKNDVYDKIELLSTELTYTDLAGGTALAVGNWYYDTLTGPSTKTFDALPAGTDGDLIKFSFNVITDTVNVDFHTNTAGIRRINGGTLSATLPATVNNWTFTLFKMDGAWWIIESIIDSIATGLVYRAPTGGGIPDFTALETTDLPAAVILSTEIDTYSELNTIVADQTLTHNGLIDTYAELNAITADQTLTHNALIDTFAEIDAIVADKALVNKADGAVWLSLHDFTSATARIPLSATPTMAVDGDFAVDTTVTDWSHGIMKYFDGEEMGVLAMPIAQFTTPSNGFAVTYNSTNDELELTDVSGGAPAFSAITGATNTTAAMVVGTGASLATSGSGTIDATTGDSATSFFDAGAIEGARGGTGIDTTGQTGIPHISVGTWSVSPVVAADVSDDTLTALQLAATLTFSDADFLDLAAILHNDTDLQGFRLPQIGAAPSSPSSGEGFLGWDQTGNSLMVYNGSAWASVGASFDSTTVDDTTWSDNANATNTWTFDVSGTDHTLILGNGIATFSHDVTVGNVLSADALDLTQIEVTTDLDWNAGNYFFDTSVGTITYTFSNLNDGRTIQFAVTSGASPVITWPTVTWVGLGGGSPTPTPSQTDVYTFSRINGVTYGVQTPYSASTGAYGAIYWATPAATANTTDTPIKAAGTTAAQGSARNFTQAATNRLTYDGDATQDIMVTGTFSVSASAVITSAQLHIYKNGALVTGSSVERNIPNTDIGSMSISAVVSMATTDYVELWCESSDEDDITIESGVLSAVAITSGGGQPPSTGVYRTVYVDAGAMLARTTNPAATGSIAGTNTSQDVWDFDTIIEEGVQFKMVMPDEWDDGTIKAKFYWTSSSGATPTTDGVTWGLSAQSLADDAVLDTAFGASVDTDDNVVSVATDVHVSPASTAVTVTGAGGVSELTLFEVTRVVGDPNDNMDEDARLLGVELQYKESTTAPSAW